MATKMSWQLNQMNQMCQLMNQAVQEQQALSWKGKGKCNAKERYQHWDLSKGKGKGGKTSGRRNGTTGKGKGDAQSEDKEALQCLCCGKTGHSKEVCYHLGKPCSNCGKTNHIARVCRLPKKEADQKNEQGDNKQKEQGGV